MAADQCPSVRCPGDTVIIFVRNYCIEDDLTCSYNYRDYAKPVLGEAGVHLISHELFTVGIHITVSVLDRTSLHSGSVRHDQGEINV